ncbi:hypothetical protein P692DRAFT_20158048, partial [Suillus brevipes Sb2]
VHLTRCPPCHCFHRQGSFPQSGFPPIVKAEETYNTSETRRVAGVCIETSLRPSILQAKVQCWSRLMQRHSLSISVKSACLCHCDPLVLSITWPSNHNVPSAGCCTLWVLILLCVRETKGKTPEELDLVFVVSLGMHAAYGLW